MAAHLRLVSEKPILQPGSEMYQLVTFLELARSIPRPDVFALESKDLADLLDENADVGYHQWLVAGTCACQRIPQLKEAILHGEHSGMTLERFLGCFFPDNRSRVLFLALYIPAWKKFHAQK